MKISDDAKREFIDRLNIVGGFIDGLLLQHPVSSYDTDLKEMVEEASEILWAAMVLAEDRYASKNSLKSR